MIPFTFFMKKSKRNSANKYSLSNLMPKVIDLKSLVQLHFWGMSYIYISMSRENWKVVQMSSIAL
jgi:hypothetical protein